MFMNIWSVCDLLSDLQQQDPPSLESWKVRRGLEASLQHQNHTFKIRSLLLDSETHVDIVEETNLVQLRSSSLALAFASD